MYIQTQYLNSQSSFRDMMENLIKKRNFNSINIKSKTDGIYTLIFDNTHFKVENIKSIKVEMNSGSYEIEADKKFLIDCSTLTIVVEDFKVVAKSDSEEYEIIIGLYPFDNDAMRIDLVLLINNDTKVKQSNFNEFNAVIHNHKAVIDERGFIKLDYITTLPIKRTSILKFDDRVTVLKPNSEVTHIKRQHGTKLYKLYNNEEIIATVECDNIGYSVINTKGNFNEIY